MVLLTHRVAAARPELGVHLAVTATASPRWLLPVQAVVTAAIVLLILVLAPGSALVVALLAAAAGALTWTAIAVRFASVSVIALGEGRAHVFDAHRRWTGIRVGSYRGPLVGGELAFVRAGRLHDTWHLQRRPVTVAHRHRLPLEAYAS